MINFVLNLLNWDLYLNYENEHSKCCFLKLTLILRCFGSLNENNNKKYNNTQNAHVFVKICFFPCEIAQPSFACHNHYSFIYFFDNNAVLLSKTY